MEERIYGKNVWRKVGRGDINTGGLAEKLWARDYPVPYVAFGLITMLLECADQVLRDYLGWPSFNLVALDEVNELAIFK